MQDYESTTRCEKPNMLPDGDLQSGSTQFRSRFEAEEGLFNSVHAEEASRRVNQLGGERSGQKDALHFFEPDAVKKFEG